MFIPFWLIFLVSGMAMAVLFIVWGIKNHQYEDQDRARYLPLVGLTEEELSEKPQARRGFFFYVLIVMISMGPLSILAVLLVMVRG